MIELDLIINECNSLGTSTATRELKKVQDRNAGKKVIEPVFYDKEKGNWYIDAGFCRLTFASKEEADEFAGNI